MLTPINQDTETLHLEQEINAALLKKRRVTVNPCYEYYGGGAGSFFPGIEILHWTSLLVLLLYILWTSWSGKKTRG